jgi:molybdenum cofactor biosynthesis enzyme MoaA
MNYYELEPENNTFSNIVVDLTHRCNMECANCYIPNRDIPDIDKDILFDFIKRLPTRTYIRLIGAEPTMRADICEIIATTKRLGHRPSLTTNGLKLANKSYTSNLKDSGLRLLLLSMNGADDDDVYKVLDEGKWATVKVRALKNIFDARLPVNTGTIIAKNVNEHTLKRQIELFGELAHNSGIDFNTTPPYNKIRPVLRMKSVGQIGRYMENSSYSIQELKDIVTSQLDINEKDIYQTAAGVVAAGPLSGETLSSWMFEYETQAGPIYVRLIDWEIDDEGVIDHDNTSRGRLTQNWTIAPFFEHVKQNEFNY